MKKLDYYLKNEKELLEKRITEDLKNGPVQLAVDCRIESVEDMSKAAVRFSMNRVSKRNAENAYKISKQSSIQMVLPFPGTFQNGIPLNCEIPLPVYAPSNLENTEYTGNMMIMGLFLMLQQEENEYYLSLLRSFDIDKHQITPELKAMIKGKYWKGNKISDKKKK